MKPRHRTTLRAQLFTPLDRHESPPMVAFDDLFNVTFTLDEVLGARADGSSVAVAAIREDPANHRRVYVATIAGREHTYLHAIASLVEAGR